MKRGIGMHWIRTFVLMLAIPLYATNTVDTDINQASLEAKKVHKYVLLFLHKDNCGYCERMSFQLDEKKIAQAIKKDFILLDINRDDDESVAYEHFKGSNKAFLKELGVNFYPALVFIDPEQNKFIYNVSGYRNASKTLSVLKYISTKSYKKMTLEDFKDALSFAE